MPRQARFTKIDTMEFHLTTKLKGIIAITDCFHANKTMQKDESLYKFIWVNRGTLFLEIDRLPVTLHENEIVPVSHLHHVEIKEVRGEYTTLLFNSNFYCIYGNDHEVSCNGFLFNGSSRVLQFRLTHEEHARYGMISRELEHEFQIEDSLKEEMLRIHLKHFIIHSTRIARERLNIPPVMEESFNIVRRFHVLVDQHFKEKKQVQDYAAILNVSPKTLSYLLSLYNLPSPLKIIHQRIEAEAKRLLVYSNMSAKEIAHHVGFEDQANFSRFFKKVAGESITEYKQQLKVPGKIDN